MEMSLNSNNNISKDILKNSNSNNNSNEILWKRSKIKFFYFDFLFKSAEDFKRVVLERFDLGNNYSILVRVEYNNSSYAMLGTQIAFSLEVSENNNLDLIYEAIVERLEDLYKKYQVESIDSIQVLFVTVNLLPKLKLTNVNSISLPVIKGFNIKDIKSKYNDRFLPLTVNEKYFGKLILDQYSLDYINVINTNKKILNRPMISNNDYDHMYLYNNKYIVLSKQIEYNVFTRDVYNSNLGILEANFRDIIWDLNNNSFERRMY